MASCSCEAENKNKEGTLMCRIHFFCSFAYGLTKNIIKDTFILLNFSSTSLSVAVDKLMLVNSTVFSPSEQPDSLSDRSKNTRNGKICCLHCWRTSKIIPLRYIQGKMCQVIPILEKIPSFKDLDNYKCSLAGVCSFPWYTRYNQKHGTASLATTWNHLQPLILFKSKEWLRRS